MICLLIGNINSKSFNQQFIKNQLKKRRKFGAIGWNIPYEFTNEDLTVCGRQLKSLFDDYVLIPFKVINYLGAEINYGGRVTDDKDVRLIKTIQSYIFVKKLLKKEINSLFQLIINLKLERNKITLNILKNYHQILNQMHLAQIVIQKLLMLKMKLEYFQKHLNQFNQEHNKVLANVEKMLLMNQLYMMNRKLKQISILMKFQKNIQLIIKNQ